MLFYEVGEVAFDRYRILEPFGYRDYTVVDTKPASGESKQKFLKVYIHSAGTPENAPEQFERFESIVKKIKALKHPRLPSLLDSYYSDKDYTLVWEYIEGEKWNFRDQFRMKSYNHFGTIPTTLDWLIQICEILEYLYQLSEPFGVPVIEPQHIVFNRQGKVFLVNLCEDRHILKERWRTVHKMNTGMFNHFEPPLYWRYEFDTQALPIFCLGCFLFMLLTKVEIRLKVIYSVCNLSLLDYNPNVSEKLNKIFQKAIAYDLEDRYQTIAEFKVELQNELDNLQRE